MAEKKVKGIFGPAPVDESQTSKAVRGVFAGLGGGMNTGPAFDTESAVVNTATGTVTGAAAGFLAGGPVGALVGGGAGLLSAAFGSWQQVKAENRRKAEQDALNREILEREDARERRDRADSVSQLRYNREEAELQKAWGMAQTFRDNINELVMKNESIRDKFIAKGY